MTEATETANFTACTMETMDTCADDGCCMSVKFSSVVADAWDELEDPIAEKDWNALVKGFTDLGFNTAADSDAKMMCIDAALKKTWVDGATDGKYEEPTTLVNFETSCLTGASKVVATIAAAGAIVVAAF